MRLMVSLLFAHTNYLLCRKYYFTTSLVLLLFFCASADVPMRLLYCASFVGRKKTRSTSFHLAVDILCSMHFAGRTQVLIKRPCYKTIRNYTKQNTIVKQSVREYYFANLISYLQKQIYKVPRIN